ncbi:MAG: hypothetical protein P1U57_05755 [Oleibacter sp.]|nr:hypothetical protein [Thalassolituus sp.]
MALYQLNSSQVYACKQLIRSGYEDKHLSKADRDGYLKRFDSSSSAWSLSVYIGLLRMHGEQDDHLSQYLPQPLESYQEPSTFFDVLKGKLIYPNELLPKDKKPSKSTKRLYSFQVDESDLDLLKAKADDEGRTVSGTLRMLVKKYLKEGDTD